MLSKVRENLSFNDKNKAMTSFNSFDNLNSNLTSFIGLSSNSGNINEADPNFPTSAKDQQENNPKNLVYETNNERILGPSNLNLKSLKNFENDHIKQRQKVNETNLKVISGNNFSSVEQKSIKKLYVPGSFDNESENDDKTSIINEMTSQASSLFIKQNDHTETSKTFTLGDVNNTTVSTNNLKNLDIFSEDINVSCLSNDFHNLLQKPEMSFSTIILDNDIQTVESMNNNCNNNNKKHHKAKPAKKKENKKIKNSKKKTLTTLSTVGENTLISTKSISGIEKSLEDNSLEDLPNLKQPKIIDQPQEIVIAQVKKEENEMKSVNTISSVEAKIVPHGIKLLENEKALDLSDIDEPMTSKCAPFLGEYDLKLDEKIMIDILNFEIQKLSISKIDYSMSQRIMNYLLRLFKANDYRSKNLWDQFLRTEQSDLDDSENVSRHASEQKT